MADDRKTAQKDGIYQVGANRFRFAKGARLPNGAVYADDQGGTDAAGRAPRRRGGKRAPKNTAGTGPAETPEGEVVAAAVDGPVDVTPTKPK